MTTCLGQWPDRANSGDSLGDETKLPPITILAIWGYDEDSINGIDPGVDEALSCQPSHYLTLVDRSRRGRWHWQAMGSLADRAAVWSARLAREEVACQGLASC